METLSTLLALSDAKPPFTDGTPHTKPIMRRFDVFSIVSQNKTVQQRVKLPGLLDATMLRRCHCNDTHVVVCYGHRNKMSTRFSKTKQILFHSDYLKFEWVPAPKIKRDDSFARGTVWWYRCSWYMSQILNRNTSRIPHQFYFDNYRSMAVEILDNNEICFQLWLRYDADIHQ